MVRMVSDSRDASNHDLKRKIISDDRCGDVQLSDDGQVDPRRARLKHENVSEEDNDDDTYLSESSDESSDDYLSETSDSESDVEDTSSETATDGSVSPVSSVTKSPDGGSVYSGSADCDPDHATAAHRHRRKSYLPIKSPNPEDPKFKGVTVQFRTQLHQNQVQLVLTAYFNCRKMARRRRLWKRGCMSTPVPSVLVQNTVTSSYNMRRGRPPHLYHPSGKQCASCCTRKTPLWRDAEDGTPLCNACGIRYKKYRVRCYHCWFVPKKDSKANPVCSNCGERFRFTMFRFRHSIV